MSTQENHENWAATYSNDSTEVLLVFTLEHCYICKQMYNDFIILCKRPIKCLI